MNQVTELKEETCNDTLNYSKIVESSVINNLAVNSPSFLENLSVGNNSRAVQVVQNVTEDSIGINAKDNLVEFSYVSEEISANNDFFQNDEAVPKSLQNGKGSTCLNSSLNPEQDKPDLNVNKESEAVIKVFKPLCADYKSDSETESVDSESDSSAISTNNTTNTSSENESDSSDSQNSNSGKNASKILEKTSKREKTLLDLPPIEDLRISLCEDACVEIGSITNIVDTLVVVESYKGTPALDLDTVLFLNCGKRALGKVFEILGPISEPIYVVRFNSQEQIKSYDIKKGLKVYFAPKTEHTNFVFMSEVLKNRGSDASWKDNIEAPLEFQDFSDDEEERLHNNKQIGEFNGERSVLQEHDRARKRSFCDMKQTSGGVSNPSRMRNQSFSQQRRPNFQRNPSNYQFMAPHSFSRTNAAISPRPRLFLNNSFTCPPHLYYPSRFSGPPFPTFGGQQWVGQNQNFQHLLYQQRTHSFSQSFGSWETSVFRSSLPPPPPPPPLPSLPTVQSGGRPESETHP